MMKREDLGEARLNVRWQRQQVATLRRAAGLFGMPYQTYLKQASLRQALSDIRDAKEAGLADGRALIEDPTEDDEEERENGPLPDRWGPDGTRLTTLFRCRTFGPIIVGDGPTGKRWTARDVRTDEDKVFGDDKNARDKALAWAREIAASLPRDERQQWEAKARARISRFKGTTRAR